MKKKSAADSMGEGHSYYWTRHEWVRHQLSTASGSKKKITAKLSAAGAIPRNYYNWLDGKCDRMRRVTLRGLCKAITGRADPATMDLMAESLRNGGRMPNPNFPFPQKHFSMDGRPGFLDQLPAGESPGDTVSKVIEDVLKGTCVCLSGDYGSALAVTRDVAHLAEKPTLAVDFSQCDNRTDVSEMILSLFERGVPDDGPKYEALVETVKEWLPVGSLVVVVNVRLDSDDIGQAIGHLATTMRNAGHSVLVSLRNASFEDERAYMPASAVFQTLKGSGDTALPENLPLKLLGWLALLPDVCVPASLFNASEIDTLKRLQRSRQVTAEGNGWRSALADKSTIIEFRKRWNETNASDEDYAEAAFRRFVSGVPRDGKADRLEAHLRKIKRMSESQTPLEKLCGVLIREFCVSGSQRERDALEASSYVSLLTLEIANGEERDAILQLQIPELDLDWQHRAYIVAELLSHDAIRASTLYRALRLHNAKRFNDMNDTRAPGIDTTTLYVKLHPILSLSALMVSKEHLDAGSWLCMLAVDAHHKLRRERPLMAETYLHGAVMLLDRIDGWGNIGDVECHREARYQVARAQCHLPPGSDPADSIVMHRRALDVAFEVLGHRDPTHEQTWERRALDHLKFLVLEPTSDLSPMLEKHLGRISKPTAWIEHFSALYQNSYLCNPSARSTLDSLARDKVPNSANPVHAHVSAVLGALVDPHNCIDDAPSILADATAPNATLAQVEFGEALTTGLMRSGRLGEVAVSNEMLRSSGKFGEEHRAKLLFSACDSIRHDVFEEVAASFLESIPHEACKAIARRYKNNPLDANLELLGSFIQKLPSDSKGPQVHCGLARLHAATWTFKETLDSIGKALDCSRNENDVRLASTTGIELLRSAVLHPRFLTIPEVAEQNDYGRDLLVQCLALYLQSFGGSLYRRWAYVTHQLLTDGPTAQWRNLVEAIGPQVAAAQDPNRLGLESNDPYTESFSSLLLRYGCGSPTLPPSLRTTLGELAIRQAFSTEIRTSHSFVSEVQIWRKAIAIGLTLLVSPDLRIFGEATTRGEFSRYTDGRELPWIEVMDLNFALLQNEDVHQTFSEYSAVVHKFINTCLGRRSSGAVDLYDHQISEIETIQRLRVNLPHR